MPKSKKSPQQWAREFEEFAKRCDKSLRKGAAPRADDKIWKPAYDNIRKCPRQSRSQTLAMAFGQQPNHQAGGCTCGWHDGTSELLKKYLPPPAPTANNTTARVAAAAAHTVPFCIPTKPSPRKSIFDVRNQCTTYKTTGAFDLSVFGYTCGKCPHCHGTPSTDHDLNGSIKIIHTIDVPRFVQRMREIVKAQREKIAAPAYSIL